MKEETKEKERVVMESENSIRVYGRSEIQEFPVQRSWHNRWQAPGLPLAQIHLLYLGAKDMKRSVQGRELQSLFSPISSTGICNFSAEAGTKNDTTQSDDEYVSVGNPCLPSSKSSAEKANTSHRQAKKCKCTWMEFLVMLVKETATLMEFAWWVPFARGRGNDTVRERHAESNMSPVLLVYLKLKSSRT